MAAVKAAHVATRGAAEDEQEIRDATPPPGKRAGRAEPARATGKPRSGQRRGGMARLFIGAGRQAGVRPQDIVGAIANETSLSGRDVGSIQLSDRFSLVEVPASAAGEVISALNNTRLKGNKVRVRKDAGR
jgi:ATP-dependent RNA helicase DeaD